MAPDRDSGNAVLRGASFLIVDDHDFMRRIIHETLSSSEVGSVHRATDGGDALKVLAKINRVDFIITDFNMPRMNGLALLKHIRVGDAGIDRATPVILLSGFDDENLLASAIQLDANGFINKPVSKADLVTRLNKIVMSEFKVRDAAFYAQIVLPNIEDAFENAHVIHSAPIMPDDQALALKAKGVSTPLSRTEPESILTENLMTKNHVLLLETGVRLTAPLLELLKETSQITGIDTLKVLKPGTARD